MVLGCDATGVDDAYNWLKDDPMMMTLAIFTQTIRGKTNMAWKPLAMLPSLDNKSKNACKREKQGDRLSKAMKDGIPARNYNAVIRVPLRELARMQKEGLILDLDFGGNKKKVHCYFPICNWMGDILGQDKLGGRVCSHMKNLPRLFFQYHCSYADMDNDEVDCKTFPVLEYQDMVKGCEKITVYNPDDGCFYGGESTEEQQRSFLWWYNKEDELGADADSEHPEDPWKPENVMELDRFEIFVANLRSKGCLRVDSVMNELDYGGTTTGQFSALGLDILHSWMGGVVKQVCVCFLRGLPSVQKQLFEEVAD